MDKERSKLIARVACRFCGAKPKQWCKTAVNTHSVGRFHPTRIRDALGD